MKIRALLLLVTIIAGLGLAGSALAQVNLVTVEEARDMINNLSNEVVLDVRTQSEYCAGHLHDAVLIPLTELESRLGELEPTAPTIVYCKAGTRSAQAALILVNNAFPDVYDMHEGYDGWVAAGYPTTADEGGCFIASAAYGSYLDAHVDTLRNMRDAQLMDDPVGSGFVSLYYAVSPGIADFIDGHPSLKPVVRAGLLPSVCISSAAVGITAAQKAVIAGSLALATATMALWALRRRAFATRCR